MSFPEWLAARMPKPEARSASERRFYAQPVEMITVPKADYLALCDAARSSEASRVLGAQPIVAATERGVQAFTEAQIEALLDAHYRQVLASPAARKVWRKLLSDASAVERMAKVGKS